MNKIMLSSLFVAIVCGVSFVNASAMQNASQSDPVYRGITEKCTWYSKGWITAHFSPSTGEYEAIEGLVVPGPGVLERVLSNPDVIFHGLEFSYNEQFPGDKTANS